MLRSFKINSKIVHKFIVSTLLYVIMLSVINAIYPGNIQVENQDHNILSVKRPSFKTSDGEITLNTPENKTYAAPMSGYYPATYGFENDNAGDDPEDWVIETEDGGNIEALGEIYGHKKVIRIRDTSGLYGIILHQSFNDNILAGTVEFWICTEYSYNFQGTIHPTIIQIGDEKAGDVGLHSCQIYFGRNNGISVYNGDVLLDDVFTNLRINYWYHIKIEFDCSDDWHLWLNGIQTDVSGYNFRGSPSSMTQFRIATSGSNSPISFVDAIGYSWDPKYNVGDNLREGLFINYETTTSLVWEAFSLDGSINKPILGDTTIAMPDFGSHTIQIFGTDSIGTTFESDMRHFEINPMNLITPENITYTEPMRGYHPGTYSFDNDKNGVDPPDWIDLGGSSNVIDEFMRHRKVYRLYYPGSGPNEIHVRNIFKSTPNSGTIEFWLAERNTFAPIQAFITKLGVGQCFAIKIERDNFQFYDGVWHGTGKWAVDNDWYHIRLDFETTPGSYMGLSQWKWRLLINNEIFGPYNFSTTAVPDCFQFSASYLGDTAYIDAIGYSWDPYYDIGDNLHEGFLLDLEYSPYLEWMGYSLDNNPYIPIKGATTIPIPSNQSHSIQIFGNDSLSHNYYSDLRYFTIEYPIELKTTNPGTWDDLFSITLDRYPTSVFIGDANNDGYNDILATTSDIDQIKIMLWNTSSKYWNLPITKSAGDGPMGICVGDANNDGYNDIVASNVFSDNISIFLWNESSDNWDSQILKSAGNQPDEIVIGDANHDSYNDIIILNSGSDVSILLWNISLNDWNPQIKRDIGPFPNSLAFGDVDNDGYNDIITSNGGDDHIHILLWNSTLNDWSHTRRYANSFPQGIFVGDANNDGFNDIIVADSENEMVSIFFWNDTLSDWDNQIKKYVGLYPRETCIEDVNNDGYNDIIVLDPGDDALSIYLWNARFNRWQEEIKKPAGPYPYTFSIGDMNNDGFNDILIGSQLKTDIRICLWNSAPIITVITPQMNDIFGNQAPSFTIEVKDTELSTMWYTIDNSPDKIIFSENETINQFMGSIWEDLDDGSITINFYANDTLGSIGSTMMIVGKDTTSPTCSILGPISQAYDTLNIEFEYTANEEISLVTIYLDGIEISVNNGQAIPGLTEGDHTLRIVVIDLAGNSGEASVDFSVVLATTQISDQSSTTTQTSEQPSTTTAERTKGAPGFGIFILNLALISLVLYFRKKY